jgi:hypothetical protein
MLQTIVTAVVFAVAGTVVFAQQRSYDPAVKAVVYPSYTPEAIQPESRATWASKSWLREMAP